MTPINLGVLTISTKGAHGQREDTSGRVIRDLLASPKYALRQYAIVSDEIPQIRAQLIQWVDQHALDFIVTTGGTGLTPRDVTPEATRGVLHWEIPGIPEAMRFETLRHTPMAMLSRSVAGVRGQCLIVNLPGNPKGVCECLEVILPVVTHALEMIRGESVRNPHNE